MRLEAIEWIFTLHKTAAYATHLLVSITSVETETFIIPNLGFISHTRRNKECLTLRVLELNFTLYTHAFHTTQKTDCADIRKNSG